MNDDFNCMIRRSVKIRSINWLAIVRQKLTKADKGWQRLAKAGKRRQTTTNENENNCKLFCLKQNCNFFHLLSFLLFVSLFALFLSTFFCFTLKKKKKVLLIKFVAIQIDCKSIQVLLCMTATDQKRNASENEGYSCENRSTFFVWKCLRKQTKS